MITETDLKEFSRQLPKDAKLACIFEKEKALVHCKYFVAELPYDEVKVGLEFPGKPLEWIRQWKYEQVPQGVDGEVAYMVSRLRRSEDDEEQPELMVLTSDSASANVQAFIYDFFKEHFSSPEFRLYAGERSDKEPQNVGVFVKGELRGTIAQFTKD